MFETIILRSDGGTTFADQVLDLGHVLVGHLNSGSRGHLYVERELPRVGLREEGPAQKRINAPDSPTNTPISSSQRQRRDASRRRRTERS